MGAIFWTYREGGFGVSLSSEESRNHFMKKLELRGTVDVGEAENGFPVIEAE